MSCTGLAYGLSAVVGAGIVVIGARFLLAPRAAAAGATFDWKAHPVALHSVVTESVLGQVFRYTAASAGLHADHMFTLTSTRHGTRVLSTETQAGPLPAAGRAVLGPSLHRATQRWLENLAAAAPATLASPAQGQGPRT